MKKNLRLRISFCDFLPFERTRYFLAQKRYIKRFNFFIAILYPAVKQFLVFAGFGKRHRQAVWHFYGSFIPHAGMLNRVFMEVSHPRRQAETSIFVFFGASSSPKKVNFLSFGAF